LAGIKVTNEVDIKEVNGKDCCFECSKLKVLSHWNEAGKIVLQNEAWSVTVRAKDIQTAIENAINTADY